MAMVICPKCGGAGGEPGSNFGDYGTHPCYFCGTTGEVTEEEARAYEAHQAESPYDLYAYNELDGLSAEDTTCPFCNDPTCDPSTDGVGHACDKAVQEYEAIFRRPAAPMSAPLTDADIPF